MSRIRVVQTGKQRLMRRTFFDRIFDDLAGRITVRDLRCPYCNHLVSRRLWIYRTAIAPQMFFESTTGRFVSHDHTVELICNNCDCCMLIAFSSEFNYYAPLIERVPRHKRLYGFCERLETDRAIPETRSDDT